MTEANDGNYLVRVRAQVMMRDDSTGGWVPMGPGGLSNVSVRKHNLPDDPGDCKPEYLIYGKRILDQSVVLSCTIKKDFEYNKVMPTFHHWKTGDKKFGLTFQTAADARAFDKGVRMAVEDLLDGLVESSPLHRGSDVGDDDVFMTLDLPVERGDSRSSSSSSANGSQHLHPQQSTPQQCPPSSDATYTHPHANHHHLHRMHFLARRPYSPANSNNGSSSLTTNNNNRNNCGGVGGGGGGGGGSAMLDDAWSITRTSPDAKERKDYRELSAASQQQSSSGESSDKVEFLSPGHFGEMNYSYVQFSRDRPASHEYSYPSMGDPPKKPSMSLMDVVPTSAGGALLLPTKSSSSSSTSSTKKKKERHKLTRARCRYCQDVFTEETNVRGSCEYAPDCVRSGIDFISCIACAQCMLYHCMADAEGDFVHHPCACAGGGGGGGGGENGGTGHSATIGGAAAAGPPEETGCTKRWIGLALLSLIVPCLCCYLPLRACHRCGVACALCGGYHEAS